jgi:hypothetical protein
VSGYKTTWLDASTANVDSVIDSTSGKPRRKLGKSWQDARELKHLSVPVSGLSAPTVAVQGETP